jgi:hypothetical protein
MASPFFCGLCDRRGKNGMNPVLHAVLFVRCPFMELMIILEIRDAPAAFIFRKILFDFYSQPVLFSTPFLEVISYYL